MEPIIKTSTKAIYTLFILLGAIALTGCPEEDPFPNTGPGATAPLQPTTTCTAGAGAICLDKSNGGNGSNPANSVLVYTLDDEGDSVSINATGNIELTDGRVVPPAGVTPVPPNADQTYPYGAQGGITMIYFAQNGSPVSGPTPLGDGGIFYKGREGALQTPTEIRAYINVLDTKAIKSGSRSLTTTGQLASGTTTQTVIMRPNIDRPWRSDIDTVAGPFAVGDKLEITNATFNPLQNVSTPHAQHAPAPIANGSATIGTISYQGILRTGETYAWWYQPFNGRNWGTLAISGNGLNFIPLTYSAATQKWEYTIPAGFFGTGLNTGLAYFAIVVLREWRDNLVTLGGAAINVKAQ